MARHRRRRHRRHLGGHAHCAGLKGKGKLKKGFKWKRGHACPVPVH